MEKREVIKVRILNFKAIKEAEAEYELEDGARILIKTSLEGANTAVDDKNNPGRDELGNIRYNLEFSSRVKVIPKNSIKYVSRPLPPEVKK